MKITHPLDPLITAGLSKKEATIWHALASNGTLNILQIARATGLHRPAIYSTLPDLISKGLVKKQQTKKRVTYATTGPKALEAFRAANDKAYADYLQQLAPANQETVPLDPNVRVFHGKEIKRVWEIVFAGMPKGSVYYRYDAYNSSVPMTTYLPADYYETIERKKFERFVITNATLRGSRYIPKIQCASRMLPESFDAFEQGITQFIFGDSIAMIDFTTETAFIITNAALAAYHRRLFQYMYLRLEK